jgi:putative transposase
LFGTAATGYLRRYEKRSSVRLQADLWRTRCLSACGFTRHPGRLKTFNYLGLHRYFLTFCTDRRHQAFADREHVDLVHAQILRTSQLTAFEITAYGYMPDHLHLLIEGLEDRSDCREFISRAKQYTGYCYARLTSRRLWQRYGYERTLRDGDPTASVVRYIIENPVRAGLVRNPEEYPFSGSSRYTMAELADAICWSG